MGKVMQAALGRCAALITAASNLLCRDGWTAPRTADPDQDETPLLMQQGKVLMIGAAALWAALHLG